MLYPLWNLLKRRPDLPAIVIMIVPVFTGIAFPLVWQHISESRNYDPQAVEMFRKFLGFWYSIDMIAEPLMFFGGMAAAVAIQLFCRRLNRRRQVTPSQNQPPAD